MCGIIGVISNRDLRPQVPYLQKACDVIAHRGPDDRGIEVFDRAFLGFRRLSIIDLSANGHQPMRDESGRYALIFNGEIYNFKSIREKLAGKNINYRSQTDTETILYGYIHFGKEIVSMLDGMFSFIIYDSLKHEFFAAHDRLGKKPLLMYSDDHSHYLFSELKQVIDLPGFRNDVNLESLKVYLTYGAVSNPSTMFSRVTSVPPGHYVTISDHKVTTQKYWESSFSTNESISYDEAKERVRALVTEAVTKRLISDVPLGAFLSGGIDSTIIVGIMHQVARSRVKTFSVKYKDASSDFDESYYAELVAKKFETEHNSIEIGPDTVYQDLDKIIWHIDQPSCDAINTYFVSASARQQVTVSLSGVGADELFAGYSTFRFMNLVNRIRKSSVSAGAFSKVLDQAFDKMPANVSASWKTRGAFAMLGAFPRAIDRYDLIKRIYSRTDVQKLWSAAMQDRLESDDVDVLHPYFNGGLTDIQKVSNADVNNYLVNTLLRDTDVMGMAHSLEIRAPFTDYKLVEFANTLPDSFKIRGVTTKVILKEAFSDILPQEVLHRKKMGFAFPLTIWLKRGKLREVVEDCLSEASVARRGWFDYRQVQTHKKDFFNLGNEKPSSYQYYQRVWMLVVLELWARKYLDGKH